MPRVIGNVHCCAFWRILGKKGGHEYLEAHYTPKLTYRQLRELGAKFDCAVSGTVEEPIEVRRLPPGAGGKVNKAAAKRKEDMYSDVSCDDDDDNEFYIGGKRKPAQKKEGKAPKAPKDPERKN